MRTVEKRTRILIEHLFGAEHRAIRVLLLLALILILAGADLALTSVFSYPGVVPEGNPVAKTILRVAGIPGLASFKLLLTGFPVVLFYVLRKNCWVEWASWLASFALIFALARWVVALTAFASEVNVLAIN
jgi:hypothetical protein